MAIDLQIEGLSKSFGALVLFENISFSIESSQRIGLIARNGKGKSTLLNRLVGEERAMVSDIAGTTRDTIEATCNIGGVVFRFVDTAGLHYTDDVLERMGIERTSEALRKAHIILWLTDDAATQMSEDMQGYMPSAEQTVYKVVTKIDLLDGEVHSDNAELERGVSRVIYLSAKTGEGVDELQQALQSRFDAQTAYRGDVVVSSQRH